MRNLQQKDEYIHGAIKIADAIISKKIITNNGWTWETMNLGPHKTAIFTRSESIYGGVSGICLFMVELYNITRNQNYLDAAKKGMQWVYHSSETNQTINYAFLTGKMGIAYVSLRMAQVTLDKQYVTKATEIANGCEVFLKSNQALSEYINGAAGTLHALLHVHAAQPNAKTLDQIKLYFRYILDRRIYGHAGLSWDSGPAQVRNLCGLSHGAGGIGAVFLELGSYFKSPQFYKIAEKAFAYEDYYFDKTKGNWPDFRVSLYSAEDIVLAKKHYTEGNLKSFTHQGDMAAWCHGSPGIGLARIRAHARLRNNHYESDYKKAIKKTKVVNADYYTDSFTLCHGAGGNADLFIDAFLHTGNKQYLKYADDTAQKILKSLRDDAPFKSGFGKFSDLEDLSLFMGNAGIGHFLLRLAEPHKVPSILFPSISEVSKKPLGIKDLESVVTTTLKKIEDDRRRAAIGERVGSHALLYIRQLVNAENAKKIIELPPEQFRNQKLILAPYVDLYIKRRHNQSYWLAILTPKSLYKQEINKSCYDIFRCFIKPTTIAKAAAIIIKKYNFKKNVEDFENDIVGQMRIGIKSNVIIQPS